MLQNNKFKLLAVDIDGTLLNSSGQLSERTSASICELIEQENLFLLSTGRPLIGARAISNQIPFDIPIIGGNGAIVATSKSRKIIFQRDLDATVAYDVIKIAKEYDASLVIWCQDELFINRKDIYTEKYGSLASSHPQVLSDLSVIFTKDITKIIWFDEPDQLKRIQKEIKPRLKGKVNFFTSNPTYLEFVHKDASKAKALETIRKYYGLKRKEIVAIGDGFNDVPMIRYAGFGVAMANADEEIKQQADFITLNNDEDGVSFIIETFFLENKHITGDFMKQYQIVKRNILLNKKYHLYPLSINELETGIIAMIHQDQDYLLCLGELSGAFVGENLTINHVRGKKCHLTHENAEQLRQVLPFTAPRPVLREDRSFGVGDRLGIAASGHIEVFKQYDAFPVLAQQSIRELNLTNRKYEDVLDCVSFATLKAGYKRGFGADGDHLKHPEEIEYALRLGFSMITLDCSEYIDNHVQAMSEEELVEISLSEEIKNKYCNKKIIVEDVELVFSEQELKKCYLIYHKAIEFAIMIYQDYIKNNLERVDFEISIDETSTPTTPLEHYYVASELIDHQVKVATIAPRFCGEFQKGIDYIGDIKQFEKEFEVHAMIARHFGYKLSIHSGSDKFSTFPIIGKYTKGNFHVKTAGTNWLEAMAVVAIKAPTLYRKIHEYALSVFPEACKYYHVTTNLDNIPSLSTLQDNQLIELFSNNDARQLIHITYGLILNAQDEKGQDLFKDQLYQLWNQYADLYMERLKHHIGHHLECLYSGFEK